MESVTVRVPAKVNLELAVGPVRADGYHELATVFHAVTLFDHVRVAAAAPGSGIALTISGEGATTLPVDSSNLAAQAVALLARHAGLSPDVAVHLEKGIPVAGGMAGGSADAAGALLACQVLWGLGTSRDDLMPLAAQLGSDVPFALHGGTAIGTGRGEHLTAVLARGELHWVFALAEGGLSTPTVYQQCDVLRGDRRTDPPQVSDMLMHGLRIGDAHTVAGALRNDLQPAAVSLRPGLARVLEAGSELGALAGIVSGSGPTCAFLARDGSHALDIAVALMSAGVCRTVKTAQGPAGGAKVVS